MYELNFSVRNLKYELIFKDRICYIIDDSGTGKTFLFSNLRNYCLNNNIDFTFIDYNYSNKSENDIISVCHNCSEIVIFDNADLYLTSNIINNITAKLVVASLKSSIGLRTEETGNYELVQKDNVISLKRW
jgi:ABC-type transporter Mla maintaining outer membrane lipid asymmetry ATPase subunit MlaF